MTYDLTWSLRAEIQASLSIPVGTFENVVRAVHWSLTCQDSETGKSVRIYGLQKVPSPTSAANYIDLSEIQGLSEDDRRAIILAWAEMVEPGFVAQVEANAALTLGGMLQAPAHSTVTLI